MNMISPRAPAAENQNTSYSIDKGRNSDDINRYDSSNSQWAMPTTSLANSFDKVKPIPSQPSAPSTDFRFVSPVSTAYQPAFAQSIDLELEEGSPTFIPDAKPQAALFENDPVGNQVNKTNGPSTENVKPAGVDGEACVIQ